MGQGSGAPLGHFKNKWKRCFVKNFQYKTATADKWQQANGGNTKKIK
jgi:hypothetical protein